MSKRRKLHFLITAGPTVEDIDPVRFISNRSSGKLGFELARAACAAGCAVTLIHGPVCADVLKLAPRQAVRVSVRSAAEMLAAVMNHAPRADVVIMNAAVADYTPAQTSATKLKKKSDEFVLRLKPTVDILARLGEYKRTHPELVLIGFALETGSGKTAAARERSAMEAARGKLERKNLDAIVLNSPTAIGSESGDFQLLRRGTDEVVVLAGSKTALAKRLLALATSFRVIKPV
jgi:phosphopantothenoylcysteine decarboxylase/phosphopantothenate--cysteine ligase